MLTTLGTRDKTKNNERGHRSCAFPHIKDIRKRLKNRIHFNSKPLSWHSLAHSTERLLGTLSLVPMATLIRKKQFRNGLKLVIEVPSPI